MSQPYPSARRPDDDGRADAAAALAARRELGPDYEDDIAAGLAERMEQLAALRSAELRHAGELELLRAAPEHRAQTQRFVLGLVSLTASIPVTAIAATHGGLVETAVCWAGIVGVNLAHTLGRRRS